MRQLPTFPVFTILIFLPATTMADGLIYQLPEDGVWVRFDVEGKGIASDGTVRVTVKGTQTIRSVGRLAVNDEQCRWIELETELSFQRAGGQAQAGKSKEVIKLLIPERYLAKGKNPRDHVLKAYKGSSADTIRELNLKANDAREVESLDEIFHAPLKDLSPLPAAPIEIKQQKWNCEGFKSETTTDAMIFRTETRTNKKAPFGVVTYKYEKQRRRNNESQGMRTMEWKLVDFGEDANSAASDAE